MADTDDGQEAQETGGEGPRFLRNPPGAEASGGLRATRARSLGGLGREFRTRPAAVRTNASLEL